MRYWRIRAAIASVLWREYQKRAEALTQMLPADNRLWMWRTAWFDEIERQAALCRRKITELTKQEERL